MKHLVGKQMEKAADSPYLSLLVVASLLLSIASFFTTFEGMLHFMHVVFIAAFITFAIQSLLLVTSWRIGFMHAEGEKLSVMVISIFVMTFCTSVFFSFSSLFDYVFDEETAEKTRMTRVHRAVEQANNDLNELSKERNLDLVTGLLQSEGYRNWRQNMEQVASAALNAKDRLRSILEQRARERANEVKQLADEAGRIKGRKSYLQKELRDTQAELASLEDERKVLREDVTELRRHFNEAEQKVDTKELEMEAEEKGGGLNSERKRGRGPVYYELKKKRDSLAAIRDGINKSYEKRQAALQSLNARILELEERASLATGELSGIDAQIEISQSNVSKAQDYEKQSRKQEIFDPESVVAEMRSNVAVFGRTRELKPFDDAAASCEYLLQEMSETPEIRDSVEGLSCDRGAMELQLNEIIAAAMHHSDLKQRCIKGGSNTLVVSDLPFDDTLKYGRECVGLASLPTKLVTEISDELDRTEREESPTTSKFTVTTNAILAGEKLAWFALIIALIIDLLVLACGLIGAKCAQSKELTVLDVDLEPWASDSPRVAAIKLILSNSVPVPHDSKEARKYEAEIDVDTIKDKKDHRSVRQAMLAFANLSRAVGDKKHHGLFYLKSGLLQQLRDELRASQDKLIRRSGILADPPPKNTSSIAPVYEQDETSEIVFDDLMEDEYKAYERKPRPVNRSDCVVSGGGVIPGIYSRGGEKTRWTNGEDTPHSEYISGYDDAQYASDDRSADVEPKRAGPADDEIDIDKVVSNVDDKVAWRNEFLKAMEREKEE